MILGLLVSVILVSETETCHYLNIVLKSSMKELVSSSFTVAKILSEPVVLRLCYFLRSKSNL